MSCTAHFRDGWLVLPSVVFALALSEAIVRVLGLPPPPSPMQAGLQEDPVLPFRPEPNAVYTGWNDTNEFDFEIRTNSRGFRDEERALRKPAGTFRIVGIGDSYTWGYGAPIEDTYLVRLQRMLDRRPEGHRPLEVISMGIGRFWPGPQRLLLEHEVFQYSPDLIIVLMVDNDVLDTFMGVRGVKVSQGYLVSERAKSLLSDTGIALAAHSNLARLLFAQLSMSDVASFDWRKIYVEDGPYESAWQEIERQYEGMLSLAHENGARILFVHVLQGGEFLSELEPAPDLGYPGRRLSAWAERRGAQFVDTLPAIEAAGGNQALFWPRDGHPNSAGYRVIAEVVYSALIDRALVP